MTVLVDTSVLITLERLNRSLNEFLADPDLGEGASISAITVSELLVGFHRAETPQRRQRRSEFLEPIFDLMPIIPFGLQEARIHSEVWANLALTGSLIPAHDLLIAATALANECSVLSENTRDFRRIPGLDVHEPRW